MIDALYWNKKIRVKLKEPVNRIDGSLLEGSAELPRWAAERLKRLGIASYNEPTIRSFDMSMRKDIQQLKQKLDDFIYVELARMGDKGLKIIKKDLLPRLTKIASLATKAALNEILIGEKENRPMKLNEEEIILYYLIYDVVKFRILDVIKAAVAFADLGLGEVL